MQPEVTVSEWQPIETAPKDGSILIGRGSYDPNDSDNMLAVAMRFQGELWYRENAGGGFNLDCHPTHWMPMPAPPKPQNRLVGFKACGRDREELFTEGKSWERCRDSDAEAWYPWPRK
jgi:hypothetical protein